MKQIIAALFFVLSVASVTADQAERATLIRAATTEDDARLEWIKSLATSSDPLVKEALTAWRGGELMGAPGTSNLFLAREGGAIRVDTGEATPMPADTVAVDTTSKLRKVIKRSMDLIALNDPDPKLRRDAANKLGFEQNQEFLPVFEERAAKESDPAAHKALLEAAAITELASGDPHVKRHGIEALGQLQAIGAVDLLKKINEQEKDPDTARLATISLKQINDHLATVNLVGTGFRGLSLASVLLIAALGLAITFGLMGVINMAHGEIIMVGAYTACLTQRLFTLWFGPVGFGFESYFVAALATSFCVAAAVGFILERGLIQFLYKRPLESMLATWGVSLVLQQLFRTMFGAANVQVLSPRWLSGSFDWHDVLFAYNRIFVIGFAVLVVAGTYLMLTRTSMGLKIRAVMQNRNMAASLGVSTSRVYAFTFAFGSGLAGMAGACLSQIGNVGPSLGQAHIVDCFMIVVLGGVGNLVGTVCAALGVGVVDQVLQPFLGAVMGKITVLAAIILFLQWRPAGLFVTRSRALEG